MNQALNARRRNGSNNANRLAETTAAYWRIILIHGCPSKSCRRAVASQASFAQFNMRYGSQTGRWNTTLLLYEGNRLIHLEESLIRGHRQVCDSGRCGPRFDDLRLSRLLVVLLPLLGHDGQQHSSSRMATGQDAPLGTSDNRPGAPDTYAICFRALEALHLSQS